LPIKKKIVFLQIKKTMLWKIVLLSLLQWIFGVGSNRKRVVELSDIKLTGAPTEIRSFMDIDGYYSKMDKRNAPCMKIMFWEDGTFAYGVFFRKDITGNITECIATECGAYKISGDTIEANFYWEYSYLHLWKITKVKFRILDKNHIRLIYWGNFEDGKIKSKVLTHEDYEFIPLDTIPPADNEWNIWRKYDWLWEKRQTTTTCGDG